MSKSRCSAPDTHRGLPYKFWSLIVGYTNAVRWNPRSTAVSPKVDRLITNTSEVLNRIHSSIVNAYPDFARNGTSLSIWTGTKSSIWTSPPKSLAKPLNRERTSSESEAIKYRSGRSANTTLAAMTFCAHSRNHVSLTAANLSSLKCALLPINF